MCSPLFSLLFLHPSIEPPFHPCATASTTHCHRFYSPFPVAPTFASHSTIVASRHHARLPCRAQAISACCATAGGSQLVRVFSLSLSLSTLSMLFLVLLMFGLVEDSCLWSPIFQHVEQQTPAVLDVRLRGLFQHIVSCRSSTMLDHDEHIHDAKGSYKCRSREGEEGDKRVV